MRAPRALAAGAATAAAAWMLGCGGQPDAERRGDAAYSQGQWSRALAEYRSIGDKADPRVWAKTAAAALHADELGRAADAYLHPVSYTHLTLPTKRTV